MTSPPAKTELQAAIHHQPERLALIGHDLRAAIADVIGGLRLVDRASMDRDAKLQLERVRAAGDCLARLVEATLATLQPEPEAAPTEPDGIQMARFLYDLEMRWAGRAEEKRLAFRLTCDDAVPAVIGIDPLAFERVLSNVLSNAIKFADRGVVAVRLDWQDTGLLAVTVEDDGPGYSEAALARLFEYGGRPIDAAKPGQGLGMHIARDLTARLGGTIAVQNRPGGGATVRLELPVAASQDRPSYPSVATLPRLKGLRALVAEDNATSRMILAQILTQLGIAIEPAEDGVTALRLLETGAYDLALIDMELPGRDGSEVVRQLRALASPVCDLPVVAVTAHAMPASHDAILAAGANAILQKPVGGIETVGRAIAGVLGLSADAADDAPDRSGPAEAQALADRAGLNRLLAMAGPAGSRELLERLDDDLRRTRAGLAEGLSGQDPQRIRAETHVLIALAGAVGADLLLALARGMNAAVHRGEDVTADQQTETLTLLDALTLAVGEERARLAGA